MKRIVDVMQNLFRPRFTLTHWLIQVYEPHCKVNSLITDRSDIQISY